MKHVALIPALLFASAIGLQVSAQEMCRSVSTSWNADGVEWYTQMSTVAENGCKRIIQGRDGVDEEGLDCNCDLVIDGREGIYPVSPYQRATQPLYDVCNGPSTAPKPEAPRIYIPDNAR